MRGQATFRDRTPTHPPRTLDGKGAEGMRKEILSNNNRAITNIPAPPVALTKNQVGNWRQPDSREPTGESYWGTMFGGPTAGFRVEQEFATRTGTKPEDWYLMKYRDKAADLEYHFGYDPVSGHTILHYFTNYKPEA